MPGGCGSRDPGRPTGKAQVEEAPGGEAAEAPADEQPAAAGPVANALADNGEAQALASAGEEFISSPNSICLPAGCGGMEK